MSIASHYTVLGLLTTAPPEVIRASYKALALIYHPDKTVHVASQERVSYAAVFNDIQAAYDVLSNPKLKAAYDAELARHNGKVDRTRSTFHYHSPSHTKPEGACTPKRRTTVKRTTPEEKAAMRARAQQSMEYFREQRTKRDIEEAQADTQSL
jgi:curved DNA-binding protein CbpA